MLTPLIVDPIAHLPHTLHLYPRKWLPQRDFPLMTMLCRNLIRFAALYHPGALCVGRRIPAGAANGIVGAKPQIAVCTRSKSGRRVMATPRLQTVEHITNFDIIDHEHLSQDSGEQHSSKFVLIVLNYTLPAFTPVLWKQAKYRLCADGGANRLYDELPQLLPSEDPNTVRQSHKPDVLKGDLDSVRPEVRKFYEDLGTTVVDRSEDQDTTDLHKCLDHVMEMFPDEASQMKILVVGALGGRMDHELGNMHVLHLFPEYRIILLSNESLLFLLPSGFRHVIRPDTSFEGPHCSLIPLGAPSSSNTTTGLQWNLDKTPMSFTNGLVSTCNRLIAEEVTVESDASLLWTTEIRLKTVEH